MFRNTTSLTAALFVLLCAILVHAGGAAAAYADDNPSYDASDIPVGDEPNAIGAADFNGDGNLDLAVTNADSHNVSTGVAACAASGRRAHDGGRLPQLGRVQA